MNTLLGVTSFPLFTSTRLGIPPTADKDEVIDLALQRAQWIITDAIGQDEVDSLLNGTADRRSRFRSAYHDLTSSILWSQVATATSLRAGSERQGNRQSTIEASAGTAASAAAADALNRYIAAMLALGYDVTPGEQHGMYAIELERV